MKTTSTEAFELGIKDCEKDIIRSYYTGKNISTANPFQGKESQLSVNWWKGYMATLFRFEQETR